ncbi:MFS general substrate transporter [Teratosphaeria destructans]|uniref:MFS general substrate transporter n=1 Tax=Teratosphaeria destructans TaxID=418781 RepID=A0A9W7VXH6_9PEZI|nr:MFS general substrate transporter [Teratosphaeria destructans]
MAILQPKTDVPLSGDSQHDGTEEKVEVIDVEITDPLLEKKSKLVRKLDFHLVGLVASLELLSFLDRSNIGNANVAGLSRDLGLDSAQYDWLLTSFYIAYVLFAFGILGWKIFPPHIWCAFVVFGWGVVATAQAGTRSWSGMMACRFLMGAFEHSFGPGIIYFFSLFYVRREVGLRCGLFLAAAPLASCFSGALAYGITSGHASLASWRVLFLAEGLPPIFMAVVTFFALPDSTQKAWFLSEAEKRLALARGIRQSGQAEPIGASAFSFKELLQTFRDPKALCLGLINFSLSVSVSSLPVFLPTILEDMGFSGINAQGLSAPPYALACIVTLVTCWIADKTQQRGLTIMAMSLVGAIGYIMLVASKSVGVRYAGTFFATAGIFPALANMTSWVINNQGSDTRRGAGMVILGLVGQCGTLLGTRLYPSSDGPYFIRGSSICAAFLGFAMLLTLLLRTALSWQNKKLDEQYGTLEEQDANIAAEEGAEGAAKGGVAENYGPRFRLVL